MMNKVYILHIETATPVCSVALSLNGQIIAVKDIDEQNIHASRLTSLISEVLDSQDVSMHALSAVAVSQGPGSYTGLRIGVSAAKGLCYALDRPLIAVHTLDAMARGFLDSRSDELQQSHLLIPMIDARRMEVYTALYNLNGERVQAVSAEIIDSNYYERTLSNKRVVLFGSGADKFAELFAHDSFVKVYSGFKNSAAYMVSLAYAAYLNKEFEDVAYFEPFYLKEFVATTPKQRV